MCIHGQVAFSVLSGISASPPLSLGIGSLANLGLGTGSKTGSEPGVKLGVGFLPNDGIGVIQRGEGG